MPRLVPDLISARKAAADAAEYRELSARAAAMRQPARYPLRESVPGYIRRSNLLKDLPPLLSFQRMLVINSGDYDRAMRLIDRLLTQEYGDAPQYDAYKYLLSETPLIAIANADPRRPLKRKYIDALRAAGCPALLVGIQPPMTEATDGQNLFAIEHRLDQLRPVSQAAPSPYAAAAQLNPAILGPQPSPRATALIAFTAAAGLAAAAALGFAAGATLWNQEQGSPARLITDPAPHHDH